MPTVYDAPLPYDSPIPYDGADPEPVPDNFPEFLIETSLTTDPFDTPAWEDQTDYAEVVSITHGRDQALDSEFQPSTATVELVNDDRRFDPQHAGGPNYGNLTPGKRLRIRAVHDATTYEMFSGFVGGWPQAYEHPQAAATAMPATDAFELLNRADLGVSPFEAFLASLSPVHWWKLNDPAGSAAVHDSGPGNARGTAHDQAQDGLGAEGADTISGATALDLTASGGYVDVTGDQTWESFVAIIRYDGASLSLQNAEIYSSVNGRVVKLDSGGEITAYDLDGFQRSDGAVPVPDTGDRPFRLVTVVRTDPGVFDIYLDGELQGIGYSDLFPPPIRGTHQSIIGDTTEPGTNELSGFEGLLQHVATFDYQLDVAQALGLYEAWQGWGGDTTGDRLGRILDLAGWETSARDIDTDGVILGPVAAWNAGVLDQARELEATEAGAFYQTPTGALRFRTRYAALTDPRSTTSQFTFSDEDTDGVYHYDDLVFEEQGTWVRNRVKITWVGGEIVVERTASITAYGPREHSITTMLATAAEARSLGEWILDHYAEPIVRISAIVLNPAGDDRLWEPCLALEIGDRVTVRKHPQQVGDPIEVDVHIEGKTWDIADGVDTATCRLAVSAAGTTEYWTWGVSTWGETTRWA